MMHKNLGSNTTSNTNVKNIPSAESGPDIWAVYSLVGKNVIVNKKKGYGWWVPLFVSVVSSAEIAMNFGHADH